MCHAVNRLSHAIFLTSFKQQFVDVKLKMVFVLSALADQLSVVIRIISQ